MTLRAAKTEYAKPRRVLAAACCALLLLGLLFSAFLLLKEADHVCTGENCTVCAALHTAIRSFTGGGAPAGTRFTRAAAAPLVLLCVALLSGAPAATPVSRKTRSNR